MQWSSNKIWASSIDWPWIILIFRFFQLITTKFKFSHSFSIFSIAFSSVNSLLAPSLTSSISCFILSSLIPRAIKLLRLCFSRLTSILEEFSASWGTGLRQEAIFYQCRSLSPGRDRISIISMFSRIVSTSFLNSFTRRSGLGNFSKVIFNLFVTLIFSETKLSTSAESKS